MEEGYNFIDVSSPEPQSRPKTPVEETLEQLLFESVEERNGDLEVDEGNLSTGPRDHNREVHFDIPEWECEAPTSTVGTHSSAPEDVEDPCSFVTSSQTPSSKLVFDEDRDSIVSTLGLANSRTARDLVLPNSPGLANSCIPRDLVFPSSSNSGLSPKTHPEKPGTGNCFSPEGETSYASGSTFFNNTPEDNTSPHLEVPEGSEANLDTVSSCKEINPETMMESLRVET